jgi:hypothetical protein
MTKEEAIRLAIEYLHSRPDLSQSCELEPEDAFLIPGRYREEPNAADYWIVHFPLILPEGILCQEPSTRGITVDTVTGETGVAFLL